MKKKKLNLTIEVKFGSEFQKEFGMDSLIYALKAWQAYLNNSHKKNKVEFYLNDSFPNENNN